MFAGPVLLQLQLETMRPTDRKGLPEVTQQFSVLVMSLTQLWLGHWGPKKNWWQENSSILCLQQILSAEKGVVNTEF